MRPGGPPKASSLTFRPWDLHALTALRAFQIPPVPTLDFAGVTESLVHTVQLLNTWSVKDFGTDLTNSDLAELVAKTAHLIFLSFSGLMRELFNR